MKTKIIIIFAIRNVCVTCVILLENEELLLFPIKKNLANCISRKTAEYLKLRLIKHKKVENIRMKTFLFYIHFLFIGNI